MAALFALDPCRCFESARRIASSPASANEAPWRLLCSVRDRAISLRPLRDEIDRTTRFDRYRHVAIRDSAIVHNTNDINKESHRVVHNHSRHLPFTTTTGGRRRGRRRRRRRREKRRRRRRRRAMRKLQRKAAEVEQGPTTVREAVVVADARSSTNETGSIRRLSERQASIIRSIIDHRDRSIGGCAGQCCGPSRVTPRGRGPSGIYVESSAGDATGDGRRGGSRKRGRSSDDVSGATRACLAGYRHC